MKQTLKSRFLKSLPFALLLGLIAIPLLVAHVYNSRAYALITSKLENGEIQGYENVEDYGIHWFSKNEVREGTTSMAVFSMWIVREGGDKKEYVRFTMEEINGRLKIVKIHPIY